MAIKRLTRSSRQLQGKLTLSYTLTTVVTFFLVEVSVIAVIFILVIPNVSTFVLRDLQKEAPQAAPYFVHGSPDREALKNWLQVVHTVVLNQGLFDFAQPTFSVVVDTQGQTLASIGTHPVPPDTSIQAYLSPQNWANLHAMLTARKSPTSTVSQEADGTLVAILSIVGNPGKVQGALVIKMTQPDRLLLFKASFRAILVTVVIVTIIAAIAGLIFGYLTARGITRRLKGLSVAANEWGHGNFSAHANDVSEDELGQVARQLNLMAIQLQNLLSTRQKLATLEERNRLARDLHDSVKQQIFSVAMQIGATRTLLKRDPSAAEARLKEAQKLVNLAQQELTSLIKELRPAALQGQGMVAALRELVTQWTQQTGIVATLRVEGSEILPQTVEEALFRVAQEALSNVARHSKATLVQMELATIDDAVTLSIADNGPGFDPAHRDGTGVGLRSMRERMKPLGGDMRVESMPGKGTRIIAQCKRLGVSTDDIPPASDYPYNKTERF